MMLAGLPALVSLKSLFSVSFSDEEEALYFVPDGQEEALLVRIRSPQVDSKSTVSS